ncbi:MAG: hypothetical protein K6T74_13305 [Geminicoccaceae bacterium]|nr:hypothetical protein [Geminicoccaceae bacterium]
MPKDPTPAQQEASRQNGARSKGPESAEGRERIADAATRHGLGGRFRLLPGEDRRAFEALLQGWSERLRPEGPAETAAVRKFVAAIWREQRLFAVEERLLRALARGEPAEDLPSLATLIRYRNRLERARRLAREELAELRGLRTAAAPAEPRASGEGARAEGVEAGEPQPQARAAANGARAAAGSEAAHGPAAAGAGSPAGRSTAPLGAPNGAGAGSIFDRQAQRGELEALLREAERQLMGPGGARSAGAAGRADPLQGLGWPGGPPVGRDLRTSASAAAIVATAA